MHQPDEQPLSIKNAKGNPLIKSDTLVDSKRLEHTKAKGNPKVRPFWLFLMCCLGRISERDIS